MRASVRSVGCGTMKFRVEVKHSVAIGPGKADVLEAIAETGSLSEARRRLGMSYQRIWTLVGALNQDFVEPLVIMRRGGASGGGADLTPTGAKVLKLYRTTERAAERAIARKLGALKELLQPENR